MSVLGFDDDRPSRFVYPALSTLAQPVDRMADRALELLWDDGSPRRQEFLTPELVVRQSTGPAPSGPAE